MNITFLKAKWDSDAEGYVYRRHRAVKIGLRTGGQGIPDGFTLEAACGERDDSSDLDLEPTALDNVVDCHCMEKS